MNKFTLISETSLPYEVPEPLVTISSEDFLYRLHKDGAASVGLLPLIIYGNVRIDRQKIPEPKDYGGADPSIEVWHRLQNLTFAGQVIVTGIKGSTHFHFSRCVFYQGLYFEHNLSGKDIAVKISKTEFKKGLHFWQSCFDRLILLQNLIRGTLDIEGLTLENGAYRQGTTWKKLRCVGKPSKAFLTFQPNLGDQTYMDLPEPPVKGNLPA